MRVNSLDLKLKIILQSRIINKIKSKPYKIPQSLMKCLKSKDFYPCITRCSRYAAQTKL